jgi:uncharacterized protein YejL (UPF0352 family)
MRPLEYMGEEHLRLAELAREIHELIQARTTHPGAALMVLGTILNMTLQDCEQPVAVAESFARNLIRTTRKVDYSETH